MRKGTEEGNRASVAAETATEDQLGSSGSLRQPSLAAAGLKGRNPCIDDTLAAFKGTDRPCRDLVTSACAEGFDLS